MKLISALAAAIVVVSGQPTIAKSVNSYIDQEKIKPAIQIKAQPFPLESVRLLDSPFKHLMDLDGKYLLSIEPDRLLSGFRSTAGLQTKGAPYGGWENGTLAGHTLGHYLSACSLMYASTGDKRYLDRVNYIVDELAECQKANGDGYVEAIPNGRKIFAEIATGTIRSQGFDLNGLWSPWYNIHKVFAGLMEAYAHCDNSKAVEVARGLGDWTIAITSKLTDEQFQKMLFCEYGGMNESLAQFYAVTGEKKYLDMSRRFYDKAILDPLAARTDSLPGRHSNTQIPKAIGLARLYELTGNAQDHTISTFFWDTVVKHHSYVTGGNSEGEYFGPEDKLADRLTDRTTETCNTYNMLKLTEHLFEWDPSARYSDYYERALYNHILASKDPINGGVTYFLPLKSGTARGYSTPFDDFTCCVGTGMENHAKYGEAIYFHTSDSLYVNLFIPSELNWAARGVRVRQETAYPKQDSTRLTFTCAKPVKFSVLVRYPKWAASGIKASVNGKPVAIKGQPGSYVTIARTWKTGDKLEVRVPMSIHTESMPDKASRQAIFYGPVLLVANLGPDDKPAPAQIPVFLTNGAPASKWLKPVPGKPLTFVTEGVGRPNDVTLTPFYETHHCRYAVYWDIYNAEEWKQREAQIRAEEERKRQLEARTSDFIQLGEMQPERDHNFQAESSYAGEMEGYKYRLARDSWFSFDMKLPASGPVDLIMTYWSAERRQPTFDILVDNKKLATVTLSAGQRGEQPGLRDVTYQIPDDMISGKTKVTIALQAAQGSNAGRLFTARVVERQ